MRSKGRARSEISAMAGCSILTSDVCFGFPVCWSVMSWMMGPLLLLVTELYDSGYRQKKTFNKQETLSD